MGNLQAQSYADGITEGWVDLETAVTCHLQSNHFPPVPTFMVPVALEAIEYANLEEWDTRIELPEETLWRGSSSAPVHAIVESFHLGAFLDPGESY